MNPPTQITFTLDEIAELLDKKLEIHEEKIVSHFKAEMKTMIQQEIQNVIHKLKTEVSKDLNNITEEQNKIKMEIDILKGNIKLMEFERKKLKQEIIELQNQFDKSNPTTDVNNSRKIVLYGLEETHWEREKELHDRVLNIFYETLNSNIDGYIENIYRKGKHGYRRPIIIELINKRMAKQILQNNYVFKGSGLAIADFLDNESMRKRKELGKALQNARKEGKHAVFRGNKLFINGEEYTLRVYSTNKEGEKDSQTEAIHKNIAEQQNGKTANNSTHSPRRTYTKNLSFRNKK